jgi:hypothetical protein
MVAQILARMLVLLALVNAATAQVTTTTQPMDADTVLSATVEYVSDACRTCREPLFLRALTKEKGKEKEFMCVCGGATGACGTVLSMSSRQVLLL